MNNLELRKLIGNTFYWDLRNTIPQKTGSEIYDQSWHRIQLPVWHQIKIPIATATRNAMQKQK